MRFTEITNAEDQLALWKLVSDKMWAVFGQQAQQQPNPVASQQFATLAPNATAKPISRTPAKPIGKRKATPVKAHKSKKAPMAPSPKAPPKPQPQQLTPTQASKQQTQQHQQLAKHISQAFLSNPTAKVPSRSITTTAPDVHPELPMNAGYSERDKDELVFHSRASNPLKPLDVKNR